MSTTTTATALASIEAQQSAGAIKAKANFIQANTKNSPDAKAHQMSAAALSNLQDQINSLNRAIRSLASVTPSSTDGTAGIVANDTTVVY